MCVSVLSLHEKSSQEGINSNKSIIFPPPKKHCAFDKANRDLETKSTSCGTMLILHSSQAIDWKHINGLHYTQFVLCPCEFCISLPCATGWGIRTDPWRQNQSNHSIFFIHVITAGKSPTYMPYQISGGFSPIIDNQWPLAVHLWICRERALNLVARAAPTFGAIFSGF